MRMSHLKVEEDETKFRWGVLGREKLRSQTGEKNVLESWSPNDLGHSEEILSVEVIGVMESSCWWENSQCVLFLDNNTPQRASLTSLTSQGVPGPVKRRRKPILLRKQDWLHNCGAWYKMKMQVPCYKVIKNFKMVMTKHEIQQGALLGTGPCTTSQLTHPWRWPYWGIPMKEDRVSFCWRAVYFTINNWGLASGPSKGEDVMMIEMLLENLRKNIIFTSNCQAHTKKSMIQSYEQLIISPAAESYHLCLRVYLEITPNWKVVPLRPLS